MLYHRGNIRWVLLLSVLSPAFSFGQVINTVVGNAINDNRPALDTPLVRPQGLAIDNNGNLIIADRGQFVIRRVAGGTATVIAGGGDIFDDAIPIPAKSAGLDYPMFVVVGSDGSIYFSDFNVYRVRRITPDGRVTNVAGTGFYGYYGDGGKATLADLSNPTGLALDPVRNRLYIADTYNYVVRRVDLTTGIIDTVAGNGFHGYSGDGGPATLAQLNRPWGLAVDSAGNLYISDEEPVNYFGIVRKVTLEGTISTLVPGSAGLASSPRGLAFDPAGNLHVADYWNSRVVRVDPGGILTTVAGGGPGSRLPQENVPATSTDIVGPTGLAFDAVGNLFISEDGWDLVRRVDKPTGLLYTFAGTLDVQDNGPALTAPLSTPHGIAISGSGQIYVSDTFHNRIRRIDQSGTIHTAAGTGEAASTETAVYYPEAISLDAAENLYFVEPGKSTASWQDASTGQLFYLAGVPDQFDYSGDGGDARDASLYGPEGIVSNADGIVFIADTGNHCVRRVDLSYIITRLAGVCTQRGYSGDGGPALQALMDSPTGLAFDGSGNLLISDTGNSVVRRVNLSTGIITLVAGTPQDLDYSGDGGPPLEARLGQPSGLAVDPNNGAIYIADKFWSVIRRVHGNAIHTLAGVGEDGFYGDGFRAQFAYLNTPIGLALDGSGNLYVVDSGNNRIRKITLAGLTPPTLNVIPTSLDFRVQQDGVPPPVQFLLIGNTGSGFLSWEIDTRLPPEGSGTFTGGQWLYASDFAGSAPTLDEISIDPSIVPGPGTYQGQIVINSPGSINSTVKIIVTLTVDPPTAPVTSLSTRSIYFEAVQGSPAPPSQILSITNRGSGTLNWQASSTTYRGDNWLTLSQNSGSTQAGAAASKVVISANPAGLTPGFYAGLVTITNLADTSSSSVQVGLTVGAASGTILTTSSSFVFYTVQGSNYVPAQFTRILNTGQGTMSWQVQSSVSEGDWLRVSPASGISDAANAAGAPVVTVSVDPTGLLPGVYGGYVSIQSAGARNTPQLASVTLRVLPPGSPPLAQVQPAGLLFTAITNSSPQSQQVTVQTTGGGTLTYSVGTRTQDGSGWLTASPTAGSVTSSTDRPQIRVQAVPGTLLPRVYRGSVTVSFSDGTASEIAVAMIVREPDVVPQGFGEKQAGCAPNQQVILSLRLGNNFSIPTGWPATVVAAVTSNCGTPVNNSTVAVSFSNGDGTIILNNQGDGVYSKDWVPSNASGPDSTVQVTMRALHPALPESSLQLVGRLSADATNNPFVNDNGVVNGASFVPNRPVSPGSIVSIYGSNLASAGPCLGGSCATSLPLPTSLGGVSVRIGGQNAPLFYAGPAQIYAQIPAELSGVTSADVVVTSRGVVSAPRAIQLDANQPGIFVAGGTQGAVLNQNSSTNSAFNPAARGSVLRIFATGLGPTNPPVTTGTPAPTSPPLAALVTPVTVTIGGVNAPVQFQALAPGYVGLYRVDVQVPSNVTPGSAVPLKFTQNGVESNQVTVAIN